MMLMFVLLMSGELYVYLLLSEALGGEYLSLALGIIVLSVIGIRIIKVKAQGAAMKLLQPNRGAIMIGLFGAVLMALPGLITGICGLLLQLPPLQKLFGSFGQKIMMGLAKSALGKMGGAGFPGTMPPGGFPDFTKMADTMSADQSTTYGKKSKSLGKKVKTHDVKPEK